jgi:thiol-disulfide isomerase/thioredoxin
MITRKRLILFGVIISAVAVGFIIMDRPGVPFAAKPAEGDEKINRLFQEMGILRTDPTPVPEDIQLDDLVGNKVNMTEFKGKIIFLNFWATWCPPCRKEMPAMEKLHNKLQDQEFIMVSVSLKESARKVGEFFKKQNLTFAALLDPKGHASKKFGIAQIPTTFVLNKNGDIIGKALGPRRWERKAAVDFFKQLSRTD